MKLATSRSKGTVRFALKDPLIDLVNDKKRESLIMLHFNYGDMRFKYSTGFKSSFENWDADKQRMRNKSSVIDRDYMNDYLTDLELELKKECTRLDSEQKPITKEILKAKLDIFTNKILPLVEEKASHDFFSFAEQFIKDKKGHASEITLRAYNQTLKKIKAYSETLPTSVNFHSFNRVFFNGFKSYMESMGYSLNTIVKHKKNLKVILNAATNDGYNSSLLYRNSEFSTKPEETTAIYLTKDEINKMASLDLSKYKLLEHARDIFLIGISTGQRVSDYNGLTSDQIVLINGKEYFKIVQKKTGKTVNCPVTADIKKIMDERYNGKPPQKMLEQKINDFIKQVGQMAGITEAIKTTSTKGGVEFTKTLPKYQLITSHTARRTFCTNKYKEGKRPFDIMLFSGHTTEKEFYKYIRIRDEERASHLHDSGFFD